MGKIFLHAVRKNSKGNFSQIAYELPGSLYRGKKMFHTLPMKHIGYRGYLPFTILLLFSWLFLLPAAGDLLLSLYKLFGITSRITEGFSFFGYLHSHIGFLLIILLFAAGVHIFLDSSLSAMIHDKERIRFRRAGKAGLIWLAGMGVFSMIEALVYSGSLTLTFDTSQFFRFLPLACILVTLQATTEELLFRVLPGRWLSLLFRPGTKSWLLLPALISGLLFLAAHLFNPEFQIAEQKLFLVLYYFLFGAAAMALSYLDGGYEIAIGIHIGNNLFSSLFINYQGSVLPTPSIWKADNLSPVHAFITLVLLLFLIWLFLLRKRQKDQETIR